MIHDDRAKCVRTGSDAMWKKFSVGFWGVRRVKELGCRLMDGFELL